MTVARIEFVASSPPWIGDGLVSLVSPVSGVPLRQDRPWSLTDGQLRWPIVLGIPYLRVCRDSLRMMALEALDAGDERQALIVLLGDQDDFARTAPPDATSLARLIDQVERRHVSLRTAMAALCFGPVADYFAYRWSSPTYLSGLALLDRFGGGPDAGPVIEVACGIGHYLRELAQRGRSCVGVDVVFSKLWLARKFVVPVPVELVCGDVAAGWPLAPVTPKYVAFCHDAFYFLPEKPQVLARLQALVGDSGRILIGHAHNRDLDHGGVAGDPRTPAEYAEMMPGATLHDDAALAQSVWDGSTAPAQTASELQLVEAVAIVATQPDQDDSATGPTLLDPVPGTTLQLNPLLIEHAGDLVPNWPSERFKAEYAQASSYLFGEKAPSLSTHQAAAGGQVGRGSHPELDRLARRRIFLDLPERW